VPAKLTVVAGPHAGQIFPLADRDTFLVGRTPDCHFPLSDDPYLSDRHFLFELNMPRCRFTDLGSRTGTRVNGRKVSTADLASGDEVRAGQTVFQLTIHPNDAAPAKPARSATSATRPATPLAVPGVEIDKEIGRGHRGIVYRATRTVDGERVAIKFIQPAPGAEENVERFLQEVRALKGVPEGNVVDLLDAGLAGSTPFVVTECLIGPTVEQIVRERGPLPVRTAVLSVAHALTGMSRLHARGSIHGNIKPSNLMIGKTDDKKVVKLTDFGIGRAYEEAGFGGPTLWGDVGRPLAFTAPEQITHLKGAGPAADQYAAAATLYFLLTGNLPHDVPTEVDRALTVVVTGDPVPIRARRAELPESIESLLTRALSRDPASRFPDVVAFRSQLAEIARHFSPQPVGESVPG
jgi:serine/threonine-protein kinase